MLVAACDFQWEDVEYHGYLTWKDGEIWIAALSEHGKRLFLIDNQSLLGLPPCDETRALQEALEGLKFPSRNA